MAGDFSWEGLGEINKLAADLGNASLKVTGQASLAVRKTASEVEAGGKGRAAVDTGAMKNSISAEYPTVLSAEVGPTVKYAVFQEFGTSRMPPHPFMGPALDAATPGFVAAMEQLGGNILGSA